jgi:hypothetical protein
VVGEFSKQGKISSFDVFCPLERIDSGKFHINFTVIMASEC